MMNTFSPPRDRNPILVDYSVTGFLTQLDGEDCYTIPRKQRSLSTGKRAPS